MVVKSVQERRARTRGLTFTGLCLVAHAPETLRLGDRLMRALTRLAEAGATYGAGQVPDPIVQTCRDAEREFVHAARRPRKPSGNPAHIRAVRSADVPRRPTP